MSTSLEMMDVQKRYGSLHVLRDFNLNIQPGEFVTFLGPSGSGKTTALKMIAGFEVPSSGDILLGGRSITDLPPYERGIGMVFQNYALFPHMTVAENVAFPLTVRKVGRQEAMVKVLRALQLVKMDSYVDRLPNQLSGGQQQRVALARAIVFGPSVLLMDEPLGALDRHLREHMKIEIMRIQKDLGITVIFVTHDQDEALIMSDRIAVINEGRLVQVTDSKSLYNEPADRFVASFVGESNLLPCRVNDIQDGIASITVAKKTTARARLSGQSRGDEGWLFVRPEHVDISITQTSVNDLNLLAGIVERVFFLGEMSRYVVRCEDATVTVKSPNRGQRHFPIGSSVALTWAPNHGIVLS